jgi:hypothetical protein
MSFGVTDAVVESHVAGLRRTRGAGLYGARGRLRNRIGLGLVEAGLHFMVQAHESAPRGPYGAAFSRRSSTAHGR